MFECRGCEAFKKSLSILSVELSNKDEIIKSLLESNKDLSEKLTAIQSPAGYQILRPRDKEAQEGMRVLSNKPRPNFPAYSAHKRVAPRLEPQANDSQALDAVAAAISRTNGE